MTNEADEADEASHQQQEDDSDLDSIAAELAVPSSALGDVTDGESDVVVPGDDQVISPSAGCSVVAFCDEPGPGGALCQQTIPAHARRVVLHVRRGNIRASSARVLLQWPRDRYLELAPRYWRITRSRLRRDELDREVGWLTIPEPLPTMPEINQAADSSAPITSP